MSRLKSTPRLALKLSTTRMVRPKCLETTCMEPAPSGAQDIVEFARTRLNFHPDEKQAEVLRSTATRGILNCSRQWGKTTVIAALAVHRAATRPGSEVIVASPSGRQSGEFMRRARAMLLSLGISPKKDGDNKISAILPNGSRLIGLPHVPETTRGFSALSMLVIEEAAYVSDEMYNALTPMLATTNGDLWLMSTPNGKTGFFYDTWQNGGDGAGGKDDWFRVRVTAPDCPRIAQAFLDKQVASMGRDIFGREFLCEFLGSGSNAFDRELVEAALEDTIEPLDRRILNAPHWLSTRNDQRYYIGVDLGKKTDFSTLAIVETYGNELHVRSVERIPLGTPYTRVVEIVREVVRSPLLRSRCVLVVDASGVGEPVVDLLRRADLGCGLTALTITGGGGHPSARETHVPKHNLMTRLLLALENGELKIARRMTESGALVKELLSMRVHENGGISAVSPAHDDLVMAVALACWVARRGFNDRGNGLFI